MKNSLNHLSTSKIKIFLETARGFIIDVRPVDAYNGWKLQNEPRGGHIPGARSLPVKWTDYMDWIEIVRSKNILPEHELVLYGYSPAETEEVAKMFIRAGYPNISVYDHFCDEWPADQDLPMDSLSGFRYLVHPGWLNDIISGQSPAEYDAQNIVICHVHYRNRKAYLDGHIPGAIDLDTLALESPETWNRRSPEELEQALLQHGITAETTVVLYGKYMHPDNDDPFPGSAAGHIGAIRCAFIMMYAGVNDVRVLNGGFQSWKDAGYEISSVNVSKTPAREFGGTIPSKPGLAVDLAEARNMLSSDQAELICVRSLPEYIGEVSGYNYIEKKGRIPGAVFGNCGTDAYHMENYRNLDQTTREYQEIVKIWKDAGITPDKHLAFYCGTGWRGSEAFYTAWLLGWPRVSVFDGGWFEWSSDPENSYETGMPAQMEKKIKNDNEKAH